MKGRIIGIALGLAAFLVLVSLLSPVSSAQSPVAGAIFTTLEDGSRVNANIYDSKLDVYLDGGPGPNAPKTAAGLPDGNYYFQVTDPSGKILLSSDPVLCREFRVEGGIIVEYVSQFRTYTKGPKTIPCWVDGKDNGQHDLGLDIDHGALTIQLMPYDNTPNKGGVYKAWATPTSDFVGDPNQVDNPCGTGCFHGFQPRFSKTDNFKVQKPGRAFENPLIVVHKFVDTDGNGVWDAGEPEMGVQVFLDGGGWGVTVTDPNAVDSNGFTPYTYLPGFAGTYTVTEDVLADWTQTAVYVDGVLRPLSPSATVVVSFLSGETHNVTFGNFQCFTVSGMKINDLNGDGNLDTGEPGIEGWTIELYRNGELLASTTTGPDGSYVFTVCAGGEYEVREVLQPGWSAISPTSFSFTAASGVNVTGVDFYNFECFGISGYKVNDLDGDGIWDAGETTIAGWTIELYRDGTLYATTTTGADGRYSFTVCVPGVYEVKEVLQAEWHATGPTSFSFTAVSGQDQSGNFLNFKEGSICGTKWLDFDHDGVQDSFEDGIAGWTINLYKGGEPFATTTTDADGNYCFTGLLWGDYVVTEVIPDTGKDFTVWAQTFPGGDGSWHVTVTSGLAFDADFGNVCEFTESRTWGYWKTHTGYDGPERDATYDLLPANALDVDVQTPDGDDLVETDSEANWLFEGAGSGESPNCSGDCRSLFRAQLLALHMSMLKFDGMADATYFYAGDTWSGYTVQQIHDAAVLALNDPNYGDFTAFQQTLDRINNNHNQSTGNHVLVCG